MPICYATPDARYMPLIRLITALLQAVSVARAPFNNTVNTGRPLRYATDIFAIDFHAARYVIMRALLTLFRC